MAAPRATQFIALRNLARNSQQVRHLHMTGPATYASPVLSSRERSIYNFPQDLAGLRAECKRRKLEIDGSEADLIARLNADELAHSRSYSTLLKRNTPPRVTSAPSNTRTFNTSRTLKAVNDSSTIDFAYFPMFAAEDGASEDFQLRVPILTSTPSSTISAAQAEEHAAVVMKPEISTMSADAIFLPFAESSDDHAMHIDFHAMADRVAKNLRRIAEPMEEKAGIVKQIWSDMVDDLVAGQRKVAL